jgi:hypothetical protein
MCALRRLLRGEDDGTVGGDAAGSGAATTDEVFELLSNERRRYVIYELVQAGGELPHSELVRRVAAGLNDCEPDELSDDERRRVHISLHQMHIPALTDARVIERDDETDVVRIVDIEPVVRVLTPTVPRTSPRLHFGVAVAGVVAAVVAAAGAVGPLAAGLLLAALSVGVGALGWLVATRRDSERDAVGRLIGE